MLRLDGRRQISLLSKAVIERSSPEIRYDVAPSVPLIARDSFVADTAVKMEQMHATLRLLSRDMSQLAGAVADLQKATEDERHYRNFRMGEQRSRESKLDEVLRKCRDLKARLDRIEYTSPRGDYHAYTSFEAISRKLAEFDTFRAYAQRIERSLNARAWLLCAIIAAGAGVLVVAARLAS